MKALLHDEFITTMEHFADHGTDNERALAGLVIEMATGSPEAPGVVETINRFSLEVLSGPR